MENRETPLPLRLCAVQMDLAWEDPAANWNHASHLLEGQAGLHDLIILPEMFSTGFSMNAQNLAEPAADGDTLAWMQFHAAKLGAVIMGSVIVEEEGSYFNRLMVVGHHGLEVKYDKRHLFRMSGEHEVYSQGNELQVFTLRGWRICPMICYDLRFPVWSRNGQSPQGDLWYDLLVYVANWPARRVAHWKTLLQARAIENQAWVAGVNRVGTDGNSHTYTGDSMIIDAMGTVVAHKTEAEGLLTATLEWEALAEYRNRFPAWADGDRFDLLG